MFREGSLMYIGKPPDRPDPQHKHCRCQRFNPAHHWNDYNARLLDKAVDAVLAQMDKPKETEEGNA